MIQHLINIRIELDRETDLALGKWAEEDERSKRHMARRIVRHVVQLKESDPDNDLLVKLGLIRKGQAVN